jgi:1,4-dihydroxy-2-naphthoate polyprenyltransferase
MTSANTVHGAAVQRGRSPRETLSAYARLSNLKVYFQWIPALVALSLVADPLDLPAGAIAALVLFVVGVIATACSAGTLDDLQGARDGLDRQTYAGDDELRGVVGKPLITGEISEEAAHRFALVTGAIGLGLGLLAVVVAPEGHWWLLLAWPLAGWLATQYSWGIKLSYHGCGELLLGVEAVAIMLIPLAFLTGGVSDTGLFEALLLGTLFAQVTVFSSSQDAEIDRSFNRMTMAARLSPAANRRFIAAVFAGGWIVTAAGFATGALEPWLALALAPVWAIQVSQLRHGLGRGEWLVARHIGWRAFDAGFVALVLVNLVTG